MKLEEMQNKVFHLDCLEGMKNIPSNSVDMILCDLPYQVTSHSWDTIIPFDKLWAEYERIIKQEGAIVLTASGSFVYTLLHSRPELFKYKWIWVKNRIGNFVNANYRPMTAFEEVLVFSKAGANPVSKHKMKYRPQGLVLKYTSNENAKDKKSTFGKLKGNVAQEYTNYPNDILKVPSESDSFHPTQKPVELFKYLIKTYTDKGNTVLDNCMGSGTTAIACIETDRFYIGFETDDTYYEKLTQRIERNTTQFELF